MKRKLVMGFALILVAAAAVAETPSDSLDGAVIQTTTAPACIVLTGEMLLGMSGAKSMSACGATANCLSGTVSCTGNSSCDAVDQNCGTSQQGYVACDGVKTWCPTACDGCPLLDWCCHCAATSDCFACCRCAGGTGMQCQAECYGR